MVDTLQATILISIRARNCDSCGPLRRLYRMARFKMSRCVALQSPEPERAARLYQQILGIEVKESDGEREIDSGALRLFFDRGGPGPVFEFTVDDLDEAKAELMRLGFTVSRWEGRGKPCYLRDPYGMELNLFEDKATFADGG
jgi:catechol 2,3-dioxygenase-like lactoylglutathione lyase family enzyme